MFFISVLTMAKFRIGISHVSQWTVTHLIRLLVHFMSLQLRDK